MEAFILQVFIFFAASAIAVPIAKKLGLGSVLGYLIAGIIIGPFGLSMIGDVEEVMHFTEFGVVMMLFLVGLELKPSLLWKMKTPILGMGGLQVVISTLVIAGIAFIFMPWQQALAVGLVLSLSSTAIVLQTLKEKGLMATAPGRSIFSVLLFQDLAVIPMLALMPLLATIDLHHDGHHHEAVLFDISSLPNYLQIIATLAAVFIVFFLGKYGARPVFRIIAASRVREVFVAAALALVLGTSLLMTIVGLSSALGTFLAGVVLADSEYRHELESDIEPFKGLLLGIFFISIGASLNFTLITEKIGIILGTTFGLMLVKGIVLFIIGVIFKIQKRDRSLFTLALAQGGEFAFVLFTFARNNGVLPVAVVEPLISAVAISMFLTPLVFLVYDKVSESIYNVDENKVDDDEIESNGRKVIIAGFGNLGADIGRFIMSAGIKPVIIDNDAINVDVLRKYGFEVYYGDITRLDLLESAGADEAELLIITITDSEVSRNLVELAKKHYPDLKYLVAVSDREGVYDLMDLQVEHIHRASMGTSLNMGQDALNILGMDPYETYRLSRIFKKKEDDMIPEFYKRSRESEASYISLYQKQTRELEELMSSNKDIYSEELDKAWMTANPKK